MIKNNYKIKTGLFLLVSIVAILFSPIIGSAEDSLDIPKTGFEERNDGSWTTHQEELDFLEELSEKSDRVRYSQVGTTEEGRPLHLVRVGYPLPDSDEEIASGRNLLIMGTFHGNEPSGREMSLKLMRDLAYTEDPDMLELLEKSTILFLPTVNPDGREANRRRNNDNHDLNRDGVILKTPEVQTLAKILKDFKPDIVLDAHERVSGPNISLLGSLNLNVDKDLQALNQELIDDYMFPDLEDAGFTVDYYPPGGKPTTTRNIAGLRHSIGVLTEASWTDEPLVRVAGQMEAANSILNFYHDNFERVAEIVTEAPKNKKRVGGDQSEPFYLDGMVGELPEDESAILDPPPCGYLINEVQKEKISRQIDLFSLEVEEVNDGYFITMDQPMMTIIPFILDEKSAFKLVNGLTVNDCSDLGTLQPPSIPTGQKFQTDFTEYEAGEAPNDWSVFWKDSGWTVQDEPKRLEHIVTEGGSRRLLTWDQVGEVHGDVEVASVVRADSEGKLFQIHLHGFGNEGSEDSYYLDVTKKHGENSIQISRLLGGINTPLKSETLSFEIEIDAWYQIVFQREGNTLKGKVWPYEEEEPDNWQITVDDVYVDFGNVGVGHDTTGVINDWKFFSVGTYGENAERAPADLIDGVDKSVLQRRVNEIKNENLNEADFLPESWANLQESLEQAETILNKSDATQSEIDRAAENLYDAYAGLSAQYKTDFSEYDVGVAPSDWSTLWRESGWTVKDDPSRLEHFVTEGSGRRGLTWDKPGDITGDVEVSALVKKSKGDKGVMFQLHLQGSGKASSENSYYLDVTNSGNIRINRNRNGGFTVLKSTSIPFTPELDTWYEAVFKREGSTLKGKVWSYGEEEPAEWQIEVEDDSFITGKVGIGHVTTEITNEWAFFGVGTNDAEAPRAPKDVIVDKTPLELKIEEIESMLDESEFTLESLENVQNALENARKLLEKSDVTQIEINEEIIKLDKAFSQLQTVSKQMDTDFSEYNVGEAPSDWSTLWRDSGWTVKENPSLLEHYVTEGGKRRVLTWDQPGIVYGNVEVSSVVKASTDGVTMFQVHLHGSGSAGSESSYYLDLRNTGHVRINRNLNGGFSVLKTAKLPFEVKTDSWYQVVFKYEDASLKGKVWPYGQDEPENWQVMVEDENFTRGKIGVGHVTSGMVNEWAFYGVGIGDMTAPRAPENLFEPEVNKEALQTLVDRIIAEGLEESNFTAPSWRALQTALQHAEEVLNDSEATQKEVDEALNNLNKAYEGLEEKIEDEVNKEALQKKVEEINNEGLDESHYTEESWKALQTALKIAEELLALDNEKINQSIVDKALSNLEIAYEELEEKEDEDNAEDLDESV